MQDSLTTSSAPTRANSYEAGFSEGLLPKMPFYSFNPSWRSLCVAPDTLPSNNCFILVLSYVSGRSEALKVHEFNRLNKVTNKLLRKSHNINAFSRSTQKVTISSRMDPYIFVNKINGLGSLYNVKLIINTKIT